MPRGARRVEEGSADLVEPLDELQPAELEPEKYSIEEGEYDDLTR